MALDEISIVLSIAAVIISLFFLYYSTLRSGKLVLPCPEKYGLELAYTASGKKMMFHFPSTFINEGAKMVIVENINCNLVKDNISIPLLWHYEIESFTPTEKGNKVSIEPVFQFKVNGYDSENKIITLTPDPEYGKDKLQTLFVLKNDKELMKSGSYKIELAIKYNQKKTLKTNWKIMLRDRDAAEFEVKRTGMTKLLPNTTYHTFIEPWKENT
ncbi:MAG: hypothetical protein ACXADA_09560 [Candidatus Hodarchaeales archaeon]|jgi:hypothetical protein